MAFSDKSCLFDGGLSNEYVSLGNVLGFEYNLPFSWSFWVKATSIPAWGSFISKSAGATTYRGYNINHDASGKVGLALYNDYAAGAGTFLSVVTAAGVLPLGQWVHVCCTYDGSNTASGVTIYINGSTPPVTVDRDTLGANTIVNASNLDMARRVDGGYIDGVMDEVAVYDKELSAAEVIWLWDGRNPRDLTDVSAPSNLVGWWRMGDDDTYPTLTDNSTNTNDGTMTNMEEGAMVSDVPGGTYTSRSLLFDGSDDYVYVGNAIGWDRDEARSYSFWYKTTMTSIGIIISKHGSGDPEGWSIVANSNGKVLIEMTKVFPNRVGVESFATHNDGNWHHVVITWSGATGTASDCKMYFDSVEDTSLNVYSDTLNGSIANSHNFELGDREVDQGTYPFDGNLDEVAIYDKELSQAEVTAIFNAGVPNDLGLLSSGSDLISWWRMGDGDLYPVILDVVGPNEGLMVNMDEGDIVVDAPSPDDLEYLDPDLFPQTRNPENQITGVKAFEALTTYYRMRGIDITCPLVQQPAYVYWTVEAEPDYTAAQLSAGALPCGTDPLTDVADINIAGFWEA